MKPKTLKVKITKTPPEHLWYKKGQIHEVINHIVFGYGDELNVPHFECGGGYKGIAVYHCKVLNQKYKS